MVMMVTEQDEEDLKRLKEWCDFQEGEFVRAPDGVQVCRIPIGDQYIINQHTMKSGWLIDLGDDGEFELDYPRFVEVWDVDRYRGGGGKWVSVSARVPGYWYPLNSERGKPAFLYIRGTVEDKFIDGGEIIGGGWENWDLDDEIKVDVPNFKDWDDWA